MDNVRRLRGPDHRAGSPGLGYALLELVFVVFIGGLIFLALQGLGAAGNYRLSTAAQTIAQDIRLVQQMNANQDGAEYWIIFDCSREQYKIVRGTDASAPALKAVNLPAGVDVVYTNFANNTLGFNPEGKPRPHGGHVALRDRSGRSLYVIVQTMTGRVRVAAQPP